MASICAAHGSSPKGAGTGPPDVLYDLLEMRIIGLGEPAETPDVFVPIYAHIEHIQIWQAYNADH
jgi:hypothetical protein